MKKLLTSFCITTVICTVMMGCGGGTSSKSALTGLPSGLKYTNPDGSTVSSANTGDTIQVRTNDGLKILQFEMGITTVAFWNTALGRNEMGTLVALDPGASTSSSLEKAATGLPEEITVFLPCASNYDLVRICPDETSLPPDATGCVGEIELTPAEPTSGGYAWANTGRAGDDDCEIDGATNLFNSFYGEGFAAQ